MHCFGGIRGLETRLYWLYVTLALIVTWVGLSLGGSLLMLVYGLRRKAVLPIGLEKRLPM
jgi:hypothetical protein